MDDARSRGTFKGIRQNLDNLMVRGTPQGYSPEPTNSILFVSPWNIPRAEVFFRGYGHHIVIGSRYLGGLVVSKAAQDRWLG